MWGELSCDPLRYEPAKAGCIDISHRGKKQHGDPGLGLPLLCLLNSHLTFKISTMTGLGLCKRTFCPAPGGHCCQTSEPAT